MNRRVLLDVVRVLNSEQIPRKRFTTKSGDTMWLIDFPNGERIIFNVDILDDKKVYYNLGYKDKAGKILCLESGEGIAVDI